MERYQADWTRIGAPDYVCKKFNENHKDKSEGIFRLMKNMFMNDKKDDSVATREYANFCLLDYSQTLLEHTINDINFVVRDIPLKPEDEKYTSRYENPIKGRTTEEIRKFCF